MPDEWDDDRLPPTRVMLRPLTSSLPLGFLGLGGGTFVLAGEQLGWVPPAQSHLVAAAILVLAVPLQALASVLGFLAHDPVVPTAMGVLAATWATTGVLTLLGPPGTHQPVLGLMLFFLAAALVVPAGLALQSKALAGIVLTLATARFAVTGVYEYRGGTGWMHAAGWIGFALCLLAIGAAGLFAVEDARHHSLAATLRHGAGRRALDGSEAPENLAREAGVRPQL